jgi:hypothetical protein
LTNSRINSPALSRERIRKLFSSFVTEGLTGLDDRGDAIQPQVSKVF